MTPRRARRQYSGAIRWRTAVGALGVAAFGLAGCGDSQAPFNSQANAVKGSKLAVPTTLTPPVKVERVKGAPASWNMRAKVAEALRQRDIPAGTKARSKASYILKGRMTGTPEGRANGQMKVVWELFSPSGKRVGRVSQFAAVPRGANTKKSGDLIDAIADAAAESITPIVPSSNLTRSQLADTGERRPGTRKKIEDKNPVTAIGKLGTGKSGVSHRLLTKDAKGKRTTGGVTTKSPGNSTAIGRMGPGKGALSKNLLDRGVKPGATRRAKSTKTPRRGANSAGISSGPGVANPDERKPPSDDGSITSLIKRDTDDLGNGKSAVVPAKRTASKRVPRRTQPRSTHRTPARQYAAVPNKRGKARRGRSRSYWVQVASLRRRAAAENRWQSLARRKPNLLGNANHRVRRVSLGARGIYYRVQAGPFAARTVAKRLCRSLKADGIDCYLTRDRTTRTAASRPRKTSSRRYRARRTQPRKSAVQPRKRAPKLTTPGISGLASD